MAKKAATRSAQVKAARASHDHEILQLPGVAMVSEGTQDGSPCVVVYLEKDDPALRKEIRRRYGEVPVRIEISGGITAQ